MVSCQKCDFKILPKMRFSLIKNFCPSCGGSLLSELDSQEINIINKKLQSQEFMISLSNQLSKDLIQNLIYDLSIFFKFDLQKEYIKHLPADVSQSDSTFLNNEQDAGDSPDSADDASSVKRVFRPISRAGDNSAKSNISNLRRAIEREEDSEDDSEDDDYDLESGDDEDVDERVKRLKAAYNSSPTLKKFRGIIRTDESWFKINLKYQNFII